MQPPAIALPEIISVCLRRRLDALGRLSVASFLAHGHAYRMHAYGQVDNLPAGAVLEDAGKTLPLRELTRGCASLERAADWFRWEALYRDGGLWADTDVVCLRPFDFDEEFVCAFDSVNCLNPAVLKSPPRQLLVAAMRGKSRHPPRFVFGHPQTWARLLPAALALNAAKIRAVLRGQMEGAEEFTRIVLRREESLDAWPAHHFFPVPANRAASLYDDSYADDEEPFPDSRAVCLHRQAIIRAGLDPDAAFRPGSIAERLNRRYGLSLNDIATG